VLEKIPSGYNSKRKEVSMFSFAKALLGSPTLLCEVINKEKYMKAYKIPDKEFRDLIGGIKFRDTKYGDGDEVERGDSVKVEFTGRLLGGREVESTSSAPGGVVTVSAGGSDVVKCVSEGIIGMKEYGSRELLVPPEMHYPDRFPKQIMIYTLMVRNIVRKAT
jgi:FKBP-type peptidyl-prolyl cis-trans isomerase